MSTCIAFQNIWFMQHRKLITPSFFLYLWILFHNFIPLIFIFTLFFLYYQHLKIIKITSHHLLWFRHTVKSNVLYQKIAHLDSITLVKFEFETTPRRPPSVQNSVWLRWDSIFPVKLRSPLKWTPKFLKISKNDPHLMGNKSPMVWCLNVFKNEVDLKLKSCKTFDHYILYL